MDTKNLKYFVGVAKYGSINAAAKAMFISQPQLSHIIKSIEEEVGFALFQRTNQGSRLTRNGESLLQHCQTILNEMDSLDHFVRQVHRAGSRLTVSMTRFSQTAYCFNDVCKAHQDQENLFLRLHEDSTTNVIDEVASGYSELGVIHFSLKENSLMMRNLENKKLQFIPLAKFKPYVVISAEHPLVRGRDVAELDINELQGYGFVRYIGQYEDFFYNISTQYGLVDLNEFPKIIYVNDRMEQIRLISTTNFFTIGLTKFPYQSSLFNVDNIPLKGCSEHLRFGIIMKEGKKPTGIESEFISAVRERYRALSDEIRSTISSATPQDGSAASPAPLRPGEGAGEYPR